MQEQATPRKLRLSKETLRRLEPRWQQEGFVETESCPRCRSMWLPTCDPIDEAH